MLYIDQVWLICRRQSLAYILYSMESPFLNNGTVRTLLLNELWFPPDFIHLTNGFVRGTETTMHIPSPSPGGLPHHSTFSCLLSLPKMRFLALRTSFGILIHVVFNSKTHTYTALWKPYVRAFERCISGLHSFLNKLFIVFNLYFINYLETFKASLLKEVARVPWWYVLIKTRMLSVVYEQKLILKFYRLCGEGFWSPEMEGRSWIRSYNGKRVCYCKSKLQTLEWHCRWKVEVCCFLVKGSLTLTGSVVNSSRKSKLQSRVWS